MWPSFAPGRSAPCLWYVTNVWPLYSSQGRGDLVEGLTISPSVTMTSPTHFHLNAYGSRDIEGYRPVDDGQSARNNRSAIQSSEDNKRPSGLPTVLNFAQSSKDNTELSDLSQRVQTAHPPLFIPRFDSLRKTCIEQTQRELRTIESELEHHVNSNPASRSEKVATAVRLLQQLGKWYFVST